MCSSVPGGLLRRERLRGASEVEKTEKRGLEFLEEGRAPQSHRGGPKSDLGSKYKVAQCSGS